MTGMMNKILWRGAFTVGGFVYNDNSILGPAIADVASWYEHADWGGIIATPRCAFHLEKLALDSVAIQGTPDENNWQMENSYIKYDVKHKSGVSNLWTVAWPAQFFMDKEIDKKNYDVSMDIFYKLLSLFDFTKGTESKYQNTEKFFLDYVERFIKPKLILNK